MPSGTRCLCTMLHSSYCRRSNGSTWHAACSLPGSQQPIQGQSRSSLVTEQNARQCQSLINARPSTAAPCIASSAPPHASNGGHSPDPAALIHASVPTLTAAPVTSDASFVHAYRSTATHQRLVRHVSLTPLPRAVPHVPLHVRHVARGIGHGPKRPSLTRWFRGRVTFQRTMTTVCPSRCRHVSHASLTKPTRRRLMSCHTCHVPVTPPPRPPHGTVPCPAPR